MVSMKTFSMQEHNMNIDMDLYLRARALVDVGQKRTAPKERKCLTCREPFTSRGDRTCEKCVEKNKKYGVKMDTQYSMSFE